MSHLRAVKQINGLSFWVLSNQTVGTSFELSIFDYELQKQNPFLDFSGILFSLKGVTLRMDFRAKHDQFLITGHKRAEAMAQYGSKEFILFGHFETQLSSRAILDFEKSCQEFLEKIPLDALQRCGFSMRNLTASEIPQFLFNPHCAITLAGTNLDLGTEYVSVIKLDDPKEQIPDHVMDMITHELPCPFEIKIQLRTPEPSQVASRFKSSVKKEAKDGWFSSQKRLFSNKDALDRLERAGIVYHSFEWHLVLRRSSLQELKLSTSHSMDVLNRLLGEVSVGAAAQFAALRSTQLGERFHLGGGGFGGLLESHTALPYYLPTNLRGAWRKVPELHSLGIHRLNHSMDFLNIFDPVYKSYSAVIVGQTGYGKSVFLSQLIRSLHHDEKTKIIVIDVKGSNRRVVDSLGGELINIQLSEPSGFNPFANIRLDASEDTLNILKEFVSSLCLEETETTLPERLSAVIGIALKQYATSFKKADLKEFMGFLPKDFDRLPHLSRFTDGIEAKVFQRRKNQAPISNRLTYYFLEKIETASNRALRKAMVNAVLMEFYLLLRSKALDENVILICDEAPFFVQDAFSIFSMMMKTMRSQKGSLILAVQYSNDLIKHTVNGVDESLINQSALKILFSQDGDKEVFKNRFSLSDSDFEILAANQSVKGQYSQFVIKDTLGLRVGRLYLTDSEFWESVTDGDELAEIKKIKTLYPELNDREVALLLQNARARSKLHQKTFQMSQRNQLEEASEAPSSKTLEVEL